MPKHYLNGNEAKMNHSMQEVDFLRAKEKEDEECHYNRGKQRYRNGNCQAVGHGSL